MRRIIWLFALAFTLTLWAGAQAQEHESAPGHEEEVEPLNSLGVFGGVTMKQDEPGSGTLALEYTRRFRHKGRLRPFWVGAVGEMVFEDEKEYLLILVAYWRPPHTQAWIRTGPGAEWTQEESHEAGHEGSTETTTDFVYRLGAGYSMELGGGIGLAPSMDFDFVRSVVAVVFGFALEYSF